jgi:phosphatidylserine decarboxylase
VGARVARGERIGLIKFGSRVDVIFSPEAAVRVKIGDHVQGGATVLAQYSKIAAVPDAPAESVVGGGK